MRPTQVPGRQVVCLKRGLTSVGARRCGSCAARVGDQRGESGIRRRPVYHWVAHCIHAHVRLAVLSLLLERAAEQASKDTWPNIRDRLEHLKVAFFRTPHGRLVQTSELWPETRKVLNQLKIEPRPTILEAT